MTNMTFHFLRAGQRCQLSEQGPCTNNNPCKNGGTCSGNWVNDEYVAVCACPSRTYGDNCESAPCRAHRAYPGGSRRRRCASAHRHSRDDTQNYTRAVLCAPALNSSSALGRTR